MPRLLSLLVLALCTSVAGAQAKTEPLATKVKKSLAAGVKHLVEQQANWEVAGATYPGGSTALAVLALLNCDNVLDDPALEKRRKQAIDNGLVSLRALDPPDVYVRALQTMALAEARKPQDRNLIAKNAQWLIEARVYRNKVFAGWYYTQRSTTSGTDASNSQYAMLGLWYARQYGVKIDPAVWKEIRDYYVRTQHAKGSWTYSYDYNDKELGQPSRTMTVAGLCGLLIAGMEFPGGRETWSNGTVQSCGVYSENVPVARALQWLTDSYKIDIGDYTYYHLYGLERAGRLSGLRFFGDHDWYREGCEFLTARQKADGSWPISPGWERWPYTNTCFALLFLSKGRTPVVMSKMVHGKWPRNEQDSDWNNDRNDLRHLTEYLSRENNPFDKKPPLAWQTYDISQALETRKGDGNLRPEDEEAIVADMLQSPILYITGHTNPNLRIQDYETKLIKRYVENGGFIFAEACCGKQAFDEGIQEWVKNTWDGAELKLVESSHPIWTCWNTLTPGDPYKLMALQVGCKTVMLYSPQDVSCHWESNRFGKGQPGQRAFELGCNIVAYATGRTAPQPRLTPVPLVDVKPPPEKERGAFRVAQLNHNSADYKLAPKAMYNLVIHVNKLTGLDVRLQPERINLGDSSEWQDILQRKFFYMHGKQTIIKLDKESDNLKALRFTLENGGLLFADACCGAEAFDQSFREFVEKLFPGEKLQRVPFGENRDELFGEKINGEGKALTAANIKCRTEKNGQLTPMEPYLEGIRINGRWAVLYSKYDIGCALERHTSMDCRGYDPDSAMRLATAVVLYNTKP